jgi:hypothetical protein
VGSGDPPTSLAGLVDPLSTVEVNFSDLCSYTDPLW